jgi:phosphate transport system substrate-binding protein
MSPMPAQTTGAVLGYDGATTIGLHLLPDLAPLLARAGLRFGAIGGRGTNAGLEAARRRELDVAGVLRELTAAEKAELRWALIGHDALGVFVAEANPVRGVTRAQLKGLFTGTVRSWRELGGADAPVVAVTEVKTGGRGTVQELRRIALGGADYGPTVEYEDAPDCLVHVARDPAAVTAASMSMAIPGVRALSVDGVAPTTADVRSGAYLLGRPMYLVAAKSPPPGVEALLEAVLSPEAQAIVARRFTPAR